MNSVAILGNGGNEDESYVKDYLTSELKSSLEVVEVTSDDDSIKNPDCIILLYDAYNGSTSDFEKLSEKLIHLNIKPIVLVISSKKTNAKHYDFTEDISSVWGNITPELYSASFIKFFFDSDTHIAYQVRTGNEKGISELIKTIKVLKNKMKFFKEA